MQLVGKQGSQPGRGRGRNRGHTCSSSHRQDWEGTRREGGSDRWTPSSRKPEVGCRVKNTSGSIYFFTNCLYNWSFNCRQRYFLCNRHCCVDSEVTLLLCILVECTPILFAESAPIFCLHTQSQPCLGSLVSNENGAPLWAGGVGLPDTPGLPSHSLLLSYRWGFPGGGAWTCPPVVGVSECIQPLGRELGPFLLPSPPWAREADGFALQSRPLPSAACFKVEAGGWEAHLALPAIVCSPGSALHLLTLLSYSTVWNVGREEGCYWFQPLQLQNALLSFLPFRLRYWWGESSFSESKHAYCSVRKPRKQPSNISA